MKRQTYKAKVKQRATQKRGLVHALLKIYGALKTNDGRNSITKRRSVP